MPQKKLLIITYYWPPSGGSGVQRWLKFVKYLPSFGWQPFVFTPENPSFELRDDSLLKDVPVEAEVIRLPIWEPYHLFKKIASLSGKKDLKQIDMVATGKRSWFQRISSWVRGNLFIPDARVFWVKPSVEFLSDFLRSNEINTIITTGPPHSLHLIGLKLKRLQPSLRWVADFRDPWSEWDVLDSFSLSRFARRKHQRLESEVLQTADKVITIAPYHVQRLEQLGGRKVELITNGFDDSDFAGIVRTKTSKFTIRHIGMVDELRDPRPFMTAVKQLASEKLEFCNGIKIEFIGVVNSAFRSYVVSDSVLSAFTEFSPPVPHAEIMKRYGETDIQLLVLAHTALAPGNLPGKFFEYLASGNFILGVGPEEGDAASILRDTKAGVMISRDSIAGIKEVLAQQFLRWQRGEMTGDRDVERFSRKALTEKLSKLLNDLG